jgi:hypothetical protein
MPTTALCPPQPCHSGASVMSSEAAPYPSTLSSRKTYTALRPPIVTGLARTSLPGNCSGRREVLLEMV